MQETTTGKRQHLNDGHVGPQRGVSRRARGSDRGLDQQRRHDTRGPLHTPAEVAQLPTAIAAPGEQLEILHGGQGMQGASWKGGGEET